MWYWIGLVTTVCSSPSVLPDTPSSSSWCRGSSMSEPLSDGLVSVVCWPRRRGCSSGFRYVHYSFHITRYSLSSSRLAFACFGIFFFSSTPSTLWMVRPCLGIALTHILGTCITYEDTTLTGLAHIYTQIIVSPLHTTATYNKYS